MQTRKEPTRGAAVWTKRFKRSLNENGFILACCMVIICLLYVILFNLLNSCILICKHYISASLNHDTDSLAFSISKANIVFFTLRYLFVSCLLITLHLHSCIAMFSAWSKQFTLFELLNAFCTLVYSFVHFHFQNLPKAMYNCNGLKALLSAQQWQLGGSETWTSDLLIFSPAP